MASKNRNDFGDFNFDAGLDFDFDTAPSSYSKQQKGHKPITHLTDGIKSAMRSKFTDPSHFKSMFRKALPDGFGMAWDAVDQIKQEAEDLYDEAVKEIRPIAGSISRKIDQLVPDNAKKSKEWSRYLKDKLSSEIPNSYENNQANTEDNSVARMLAELENNRSDQQDADKYEGRIQNAINQRAESKRFQANAKLLGVIANEVSGTRNFLTTFNVSYQKKSLELQFRSYAAQASLLKSFNDFSKRNNSFQDALLLNTSLPEYAKTSNTQRWKQLSKEQMFGGINDRLFGSKSRIGAAGSRLIKKGKEKLGEYKDRMMDIDDMLQAVIDSKEMEKEMAEVEGRQASGYRTLGSFAGDMGVDMISDWISGKVKGFASKNKGLMKKSFSVGRYAANPGALFEKIRGSKTYKDMGSSDNEMTQMFQSVLGGLLGALREEGPDMSIKNVSIGATGEDKLHTQMRAQRSLADVIPGYLSRILREITILRTGDLKTGLTGFDVNSGEFKAERLIQKDLIKSLRSQAASAKVNKDTYSESSNKLYNTFTGGQKLEGKSASEVQTFLNKLSRSTDDMDLTGPGIKKTKEYQSLTGSTKKQVDSILDSRFTGDSYEAVGNQFDLTRKAVDTKSSIGTLHETIKEAIKNGYGHLLEEEGVIKRSANPNNPNGYDIDKDAYYKFFDDSVTPPSDVNLKKNIRSSRGPKVSATRALRGFKKTNIPDWEYKGGGGKRYRGPMAQDVRSNFGEDAAPGGRSLDLVNLNGYTMSAVKSLMESVEAMSARITGKSEDGQSPTESVLTQIRDLLAIGKDGKRVKAIMARGEAAGVRLKELSLTSIERMSENTQQVGNALLTQMRDLIASDKPTEIIDDIYNRTKSTQVFLKTPIIGQKAKAFANKIKGAAKIIQGHGDDNSSDTKTGDATHPDSNGAPVNGSNRGIGGLLGGIGGLFGAGKKAALGLGGAFSQRFPGFMRDRSAREARIAARRAKRKFGKTRVGKFAAKGFGRLGLLATAAGGLMNAFGGGQDDDNQQQAAPEADGTNTYSAADHAARLFASGKARLTKGYSAVKGAFGDRDGDGQRDGGVSDRMEAAADAQQANEERKKAGIEASKRGAEAKAARNTPADNAIEKMIAAATGGLGKIAGAALSIMEVAAGVFGIGGMGKGLAKGLGNVWKAGKGIFNIGSKVGGGLLRGASSLGRGVMGIGRGLGGIGKGVMSIASRVPGVARVGRVAMAATRVAQVVGLAGGGGAGMVSSALGVLGGLISWPVVIGAAVVGGLAYGGYKLYKAATRNNLDDWERIRALQYGLDGTDVAKSFNGKVMGLEQYLLDGKLAFDGNRPYINTRSIDLKEIMEMFSISDDDTELAENFGKWWGERFQPVFLHHVANLYKIDKKASLSKLNSLTPQQKLDYLATADISGIWDKTTSPFKGLDVLNNNPESSRTLIDAKIKTVGKEMKGIAEAAIKYGAVTPKGDDAKNAKEVIKSAAPAVLPNGSTTTSKPSEAAASNSTAPTTPRSIPANSKLAQYMKNGVSEDGSEPKKMAATTMGFSGMGASGLKMAGGAMSDGANGMQYVKLDKDVNIDLLHPRMRSQFLSMAQEYGEATGKTIGVNEAFRTYGQQMALWRANPQKAARPGSSMHEYGLAMDIDTVIMNELEKLGLLKKYGFTRPIRGETWHMEASGIQQAIQKAKTDPQLADQLIQASLGRGGGGYGSVRSNIIGGRSPEIAKAVFGYGPGETVVAKDDTSVPTTPVAKESGSYASAGRDQSVSFSGNNTAPSGAGGGRGSMGMSGGVVTGGGSAGGGSSSGGRHDDMKAIVAKAAGEAGVDPNKMLLMTAMESGFNNNAAAGTSSAKGAMQFTDKTWNEQMNKHGSKYGLASDVSRSDPRASALMAAEYMKSNSKALGGTTNFTEEYMGHLLGASGARSLLTADPNSFAADIRPDAAASNRDIFYNNGQKRTVRELKIFLDQRIQQKAKAFGISMPGAATSGVVSGVSVAASSNSRALAATGGTDTPTKAPGVGFEPPAAKSSMVSALALGGGYRAPDPSIQVTSQLFDRLSASADTQIKHLSSIDEAILNRVVPLLETISTNTASGGSGSGSGSTESKPTPTPSVRPERSTKKVADASSFDNRRTLTT